MWQMDLSKATYIAFKAFMQCHAFHRYIQACRVSTGLNNEEYQIVIGNDTTRYIIDDLEAGRNYTFYIVAYMPMGASRMSDHVIQRTFEDGEYGRRIRHAKVKTFASEETNLNKSTFMIG